MASRIVTRTLEMDVLGSRFLEGPVSLDGSDVCSALIEIDQRGTTKSVSTGAASLRAGISPNDLYAFTVDALFGTGGATYIRLVGDDVFGVAGDAYLDAFVTAAESGLILRFTLYLNNRAAA